MHLPHRINHSFYAAIIAVIDFVTGILVYWAITIKHPAVHLISPSFMRIQHLPMWAEALVYAGFWSAAFGLWGLYRHLGHKGIGRYLSLHLGTTFIGLVFFTFLFFVKNDSVFDYGFFHFFFEIWSLTTAAFLAPKMLYYLWYWWLMKTNRAAIHAILIGNTAKAKTVLLDFAGQQSWFKYHFTGYIETSANGKSIDGLPCLGDLSHLPAILDNAAIDEVIVAIDSHEFKKIETVLAEVRQRKITIRLLPDLNAILEGTVKTDNITGLPLITINNRLMPEWQAALKAVFDIAVAVAALAVSLPLVPFIVVAIKTSSPGPVFFYQKRMGKGKRAFTMIKFRSMYVDSEANGPSLSSTHDPRITPFGKIMRKWHIDEIPQFVNVLKGDMSIVGPRPERKYFIDQIVKIAPHYNHLFSVKPGITSWGMVKFGYAENVEQMVQRLRYDILYLENISLWVDIKIIAYTVMAVFKGDGK